MNYQTALKLIESKFNTRYVDEYARAVKLNLTYDGVNVLHVVLCEKDGMAFLSDEGVTKIALSSKINEEEIFNLCENVGFAFNEFGHIEIPFLSIEDLYAFIDFLLFLCDVCDSKGK